MLWKRRMSAAHTIVLMLLLGTLMDQHPLVVSDKGTDKQCYLLAY